MDKYVDWHMAYIRERELRRLSEKSIRNLIRKKQTPLYKNAISIK